MAFVADFLGHPDAPVVAERLAHQGQFRLMFARHRNTGWVNLGETRIGEQCAAFMGAVGCRHVAALGVGRKIKYIAITARAQHHCVARVGFDFARDHIAGDNAPRFAINHHNVEHFGARVHLHFAQADLPFQRLIRADQQLLASLSTRIKCARNLCAAE